VSATPLYDAAAWAAGFAPLDDDASHAAECARYDQAAAALADDDRDDLPVSGGDAA
jgi:hypothetical protein